MQFRFAQNDSGLTEQRLAFHAAPGLCDLKSGCDSLALSRPFCDKRAEAGAFVARYRAPERRANMQISAYMCQRGTVEGRVFTL